MTPDVPSSMFAACRHVYGSPSDIRLERVPVPQPRAGEVLVRVRASSLNASDWEGLTGKPLYARVFGLLRPRYPILGSDFAGEIVAVGKGVTGYSVGEEVLGDAMGTFGTLAEYVCVRERTVMKKPPSLSFEIAATLPQSGCIAMRGIATQSRVKPGARVLINGAGGGSGTLAIQLAKAAGARVTGVDRGEKFDVMRAMGAHEVIDFRESDFSSGADPYDLILDLVATRRLRHIAPCLNAGGKYLVVGGAVRCLLETAFCGSLRSLFTKKSFSVLAVDFDPAALDVLVQKYDEALVHVHVDRTFPLSEVRDAFVAYGSGQVPGKLVITT